MPSIREHSWFRLMETSMTVLIADIDLLGFTAMCPTDCEIRTYKGRHIPRNLLEGADALFVRSSTRIETSELPDSIKFIGTATIGTDHLPLTELSNIGVHVVSAPGCNADAVVDYVLWHIMTWSQLTQRTFRSLTLGVVGIGQIGSRLISCAQSLGMRTLQSDIPRYEQGGFAEHCDIKEVISKSDIVSIHVPFVAEGCYATLKLIDYNWLTSMKSKSLLINTSRGRVLCEHSFLKAKLPHVVLDVFPDEPFISDALIDRTWHITPHIAGHSAEGKLKGTEKILAAYCRYAGKQLKTFDRERLLFKVAGASPVNADFIEQLLEVGNFDQVDKKMRDAICANPDRVAAFDLIRRQYRLRREAFRSPTAL